jgi:hypothetical protein
MVTGAYPYNIISDKPIPYPVPYHIHYPVDHVLHNFFDPELSELVFSADNETVTKVIDLVVSNVKSFTFGVTFPEFYYGPASDALLSPSLGKQNFRLNIIFNKRAKLNNFLEFWSLFYKNNIQFTFHWGKFLPSDKSNVEIWCHSLKNYGGCSGEI